MDKLSKCDAVIFGPGLGQSEKVRHNLKSVLNLNLPTVIDADGLNILANQPELFDHIHSKCVLTPHPGEFERLAKTAEIKTADELAKKLGCCVILKGYETFVRDGQQNYINKLPNPALATGGTGDVLAGLIGGLFAQYSSKLSVFECASLSVKIHAQAGLTWSHKYGSSGLIIDELIDLIPATIDKLRN